MSLPVAATVRRVKRCIQDTRKIPVFTQKLVVGALIVSDDVTLAELPQPLTMTLVVCAYTPEMGVILLNAAEEGDARGAERALQALADPNHSDADGWTPMHMASLNGHAEVVHLLCDNCADKNKTAQDGGTALNMASWSGHVEVVRLLCESGADLNRPQHNGWTALHIASRNGNSLVVKVLLEGGVDKNQRLKDGRKAFHIARRNRHFDVMGLLREASPPWHAQFHVLGAWIGRMSARLPCTRAPVRCRRRC